MERLFFAFLLPVIWSGWSGIGEYLNKVGYLLGAEGKNEKNEKKALRSVVGEGKNQEK